VSPFIFIVGEDMDAQAQPPPVISFATVKRRKRPLTRSWHGVNPYPNTTFPLRAGRNPLCDPGVQMSEGKMANIHFGRIGDIWKHLPLFDLLCRLSKRGIQSWQFFAAGVRVS
jgi:hypothetical protein